MQLATIDGSTLKAPEGENDDRADAYALACVAMHRVQKSHPGGVPTALPLRNRF